MIESAKSARPFLHRCPSCGEQTMEIFFDVERVPVHSVLLFATRDEAVGFQTGKLHLGICSACGFISNVSFDGSLLEYSSRYESTQTYSETFTFFQRRLAEALVAKHRLYRKNIVEIGCGNGEFLALLCDLGDNRGVGYDPAAREERKPVVTKGDLTVIPDLYSAKARVSTADFVCCLMTLEHIPDVAEFVGMVRRSLGQRRSVTVFFQLPDVRRILREKAFWDIYYEHCSYFSPGSLAGLFRRAGFSVTDLWTYYDDQYLMIEADVSAASSAQKLDLEEEPAELMEATQRFAAGVRAVIGEWDERLSLISRGGKKVVLWGSGSKAVAFLTKLKSQATIDYIVDINPHKWGTYSAGTGQKIIAPDFLRTYRPDVVVIMNPIYTKEIAASLQVLDVQAELVPLMADQDGLASSSS